MTTDEDKLREEMKKQAAKIKVKTTSAKLQKIIRTTKKSGKAGK